MTDDGFFISVEAWDPKFDADRDRAVPVRAPAPRASNWCAARRQRRRLEPSAGSGRGGARPTGWAVARVDHLDRRRPRRRWVSSPRSRLRRAPSFYFSWLVAYLYFLSIALGALFFVLVAHRLPRGLERDAAAGGRERDGDPAGLRAALRADLARASRAVRLDDATEVAKNPLLRGKAGFLNEGFFFDPGDLLLHRVERARHLLFTAIAEAGRVRRRADQRAAAQVAAAPGLIALQRSPSTFATIDWMMSLEPEWYSTMIGVYFFAGSLLVDLRLRRPAVEFRLRPGRAARRRHDRAPPRRCESCSSASPSSGPTSPSRSTSSSGMANIPEETIYYMKRHVGSWQSAGMLLAVGHFLVPVLLL